MSNLLLVWRIGGGGLHGLVDVEQLDSASMPTTFKRSIQPDLDNLQSFSFSEQPLSEGNHVCVIMLPRQTCSLAIPAEGATHSFDAISAHRFAIAGAAEHDTPFNFMTHHR